MVKQTVRNYLILTFLESFGVSFAAATYVVYLMSFGLNYLDVNLINLCFFVFLFCAEVPTGLIADVFGRKVSYILACFIFGAGMVVYSLAETVVAFLVAEMIAAVGKTLATGAFQAWMIDRVNFYNGTVVWEKIFAWQEQVRYTGMIGGAIMGAWIAEYYQGAQWLVGGLIVICVGVLACLLMREEYFVPTQGWRKALERIYATLHNSRSVALSNKSIRLILVLTGVQSFAVMAPNMQWQPLFTAYIPSPKYLGYIFAGNALALCLGARWSVYLQQRMSSSKTALLQTQALIALGILLTALSWEAFLGLSAFFVHEIARGMYKPLRDVYLNRHIHTQERATLISIEAQMAHLGGIIGLIFSGWVALHYSITIAWCSMALIVLANVVWFLKTR